MSQFDTTAKSYTGNEFSESEKEQFRSEWGAAKQGDNSGVYTGVEKSTLNEDDNFSVKQSDGDVREVSYSNLKNEIKQDLVDSKADSNAPTFTGEITADDSTLNGDVIKNTSIDFEKLSAQAIEGIKGEVSNPNGYLPQGEITASADFPTTAEVQTGWQYIITTNVTDNDPTKTNTGDSFLAGTSIVWKSGGGWMDLGVNYVTQDQKDKIDLGANFVKHINLSSPAITPFEGAVVAPDEDGVYGNYGGLIKYNELCVFVYESSVWVKKIIESDFYLKTIDSGLVSLNLFNKNDVTPNTSVTSDGSLGAAAGFNSSGFLPVEGGETYTLNGGHPFAFYDEYKVFIVWGDTMSTQTAPANAGFIRITVPDANLDTAKLEVGAIETPYSEWKLQIPSDRISDLQDGVEAVDFVKSLVGKNLIDKTTLIDGYYVEYLSGNLAPAAGFSASQFIKINENTDYYLSSTNQIAFYDQAQEYISGILAAKDFTSVAGAEWIRVTVINTKIDTVQLEENTYGTFYEPFIKRIPAKRVGDLNYDIYETKNIVTVRANGTVGVDCDFSGRNAIQDAIDSILDASISNPYTVFVYDGFYYVLNSSEYKGNLPTGPSMIALKDYVSLEGESEKGVIIHAELPFNDGDIDTAISRDLHQTIYARSRGSKVSKCTLIGQDVRYTNHSDNTGNADSERVYENVSMIFRGTKGFRFAWGCGTFSGEKNRVIGGSTRTPKITFSTHNNTAFEKPSLWSFENHDFYSQADFGTGPNLENNGSLKEDEFFLKNCLMNNCYRMTYNELWISPLLENASFNHAEWRIKGSGNSKILFDPNISQGLSLRVISDSVGDSSSVTFNESSTAFDVLIKNPKFEKTPIVRHDRFLYWKSGYTYFRGSTGLSGYAFGNLDISDSGASSETSLGARLGDLSVTSKTLTINIDGVNYDIVFNEDYTSQPNSYVLAQINAVISGFGVCDEYCFGKEYYPEFTDVLNVLANNQASYIPKGKIVTEDGAGGIKIAEDGDKVLGVAIENIPTFKTTSNEQYNTGRFISNCYIYDSEQGEHFFVLCSKSSVVGEKYKVTNGELVLDTGGTITPFKDGIFEF